MEVKRVYGALKISACEKIITLSSSSDNYATASTYFSERCEQGVEEACFFLARVAERQRDLAKAISLMNRCVMQAFRCRLWLVMTVVTI